MHSASMAAIPAVVGAGLRMTALPLASAGPTYSTGMFIGKFQGVIATTTPRGWRKVITRLWGSSTGIVSPVSRRASPAASRNPLAADAISPERLGQGLAVLEDEVVGHRLAAGIDDVGDALELGRAFEGGAPAVAFEGLVRPAGPRDRRRPGPPPRPRPRARRSLGWSRSPSRRRRRPTIRRPRGADGAGSAHRVASS